MNTSPFRYRPWQSSASVSGSGGGGNATAHATADPAGQTLRNYQQSPVMVDGQAAGRRFSAYPTTSSSASATPSADCNGDRTTTAASASSSSVKTTRQSVTREEIKSYSSKKSSSSISSTDEVSAAFSRRMATPSDCIVDVDADDALCNVNLKNNDIDVGGARFTGPRLVMPAGTTATTAAVAASAAPSSSESSGGDNRRLLLTSPTLVATTAGNSSDAVAVVGQQLNGGGHRFGGHVTKSSKETSSANASRSVRIVDSSGATESYSTSSQSANVTERLERDGVVAERHAGIVADRVKSQNRDGDVARSTRVEGTRGETLRASDERSDSSVVNVGRVENVVYSSADHTSGATGVTRSRQSLKTLNVNNIDGEVTIQMSTEELNNGLDAAEAELMGLNVDAMDASDVRSVETALTRYCGLMSNSVAALKSAHADAVAAGGAASAAAIASDSHDQETPHIVATQTEWTGKMSNLLMKAWKVPTFGLQIGINLCHVLRRNGGLDVLIANCDPAGSEEDLKLNSARLLEQCLVTENRSYVVAHGLDKVVGVAKDYTQDISDVERSRIGTGLLESLFKHSESTCGDVIDMGGLDTVVNECKSTDVETLRHCASALANVAIYGGAENQEAMIRRRVPSWLFPLAFHDDDTIKYFACLAIAALVANKEIEASVERSGTLHLIGPFVQSHSPRNFAAAVVAAQNNGYSGQSVNWLRRLVPILDSAREEARNLAAFHFCLEAEMRTMQHTQHRQHQQQKQVSAPSSRSAGPDAEDERADLRHLFSEVGATSLLCKLASTPTGMASKYAVRTLRLLGEEVPHKLSQQVPVWSVEDVRQWIRQVGFAPYADAFVDSRVDGDLLLQITDDMLHTDLGMTNGLLRRRFLREIAHLKRVADYSSCDASNLNAFLASIKTGSSSGQDLRVYTYTLLIAGLDADTLVHQHVPAELDSVLAECGVDNKVHRRQIAYRCRIERGDAMDAHDAILDDVASEAALRRSSVRSVAGSGSPANGLGLHRNHAAAAAAAATAGFRSTLISGGRNGKKLDAFISYRRSNGSQLASLLKVHLEIRNYSVFIDVDRLEAGKFDNNLLASIQSAANFLLVLTPNSLDRCLDDTEQKDWIHKEVACAIASNCNIIPVMDNFSMPDAAKLPETMRQLVAYNGIKWIHDYQDACVDKIDRFLRGDAALTAITTANAASASPAAADAGGGQAE